MTFFLLLWFVDQGIDYEALNNLTPCSPFVTQLLKGELLETQIKFDKELRNVADSSDSLAHEPSFSKIEFVCIDDKSQPFFIVRPLQIEKFCSYLNAYKIQIICDWLCMPYETVNCVKPSCIITDVHGETYVV